MGRNDAASARLDKRKQPKARKPQGKGKEKKERRNRKTVCNTESTATTTTTQRETAATTSGGERDATLLNSTDKRHSLAPPTSLQRGSRRPEARVPAAMMRDLARNGMAWASRRIRAPEVAT